MALRQTQGAAPAVINTAYVERLNATFCARLASLARRTRAGVHRRDTLEAGMWLVGTVYTFCRPQASLQLRVADHWAERTPAQAAGLMDCSWTVRRLLPFPVPGPLVTRRGPPPHWLRDAARAAGHAA